MREHVMKVLKEKGLEMKPIVSLGVPRTVCVYCSSSCIHALNRWVLFGGLCRVFW